MKDQYVGDIGDFEKYSVLRALQSATRLQLVVCWMLTTPDATGEGGKVDYLRDPDRYRHLDAHVFDRLDELVHDERRSTQAVESAGVLADAQFVRSLLTNEVTSRRRMLDEVLLADGDKPSLVFFDPDIGIAPASVRSGRRRSSMYLFYDEAAEVFARGHSLVIYQHFAHEQRQAFLNRKFEGLAAACEPAQQFALYSGRVAFLVVAHERHEPRLRSAAAEIEARWAPRLTFVAAEDLPGRGTTTEDDEITLYVSGYPPTKNEAKSLLSDGHDQFERVRLLLEQAGDAIATGALPLGAARIGLELVVGAPTDAPSDATNYLGGIGDVLQDKSRRGRLDHLGQLAHVALFNDDRQVREVSYREEHAAEPHYTVRVWRLKDRRPA